MRKQCDDKGQALVVVALGIVVLMGVAGLAVDMGYMRYQKRQLQQLADSAAMAGAREMTACNGTADCAALTTAAQKALTENNVTPTVVTTCTPSPAIGTTTLTVNNGPSCGGANDPNNSNVNYVEAIVARTIPTTFTNILGISSSVVLARAEAGVTKNTTDSIVLLGRSGTDLTIADAAANITANAGIYVDANASCNSNARLTSSVTSVSGTNSGCTTTPAAITGALPVADPLAYMEANAPAVSSICTAYTGQTSLSPGTYCGINDNGTNITFAAGTYVIEGAFQVKNATVTGTGVTFFLTGTSTNPFGGIVGAANGVFGSNAVQFSAPNSGTYAGMLFWQDPNAVGLGTPGSTTGMTFASNSICNCQGIMYFPTTHADYQGGPNDQYDVIVAYSLSMHGSAVLGNNFSGVTGFPLRAIAMGE